MARSPTESGLSRITLGCACVGQGHHNVDVVVGGFRVGTRGACVQLRVVSLPSASIGKRRREPSTVTNSNGWFSDTLRVSREPCKCNDERLGSRLSPRSRIGPNRHVAVKLLLTQYVLACPMATPPPRRRIKFSDVALGQRFYDPISAEYFIKRSASHAAMISGAADGSIPDEFEDDDLVGIGQN